MKSLPAKGMTGATETIAPSAARDPRETDPDTVADGSPWWADAPKGCERCGADDISPNVEAYELSGECVCDDCAEEIFEDNSQFGVGA